MSDQDTHQQATYLAAIVAEQLEDKVTILVENIDGRIERRAAPLQTGIDSLQQDVRVMRLALKDTNHDLKTLAEDTHAGIIAFKNTQKDAGRHLQSLDRAVGNVEHKIDNLTKIVTDHYLGRVWHDRALLLELDDRVSQLEKATG